MLQINVGGEINGNSMVPAYVSGSKLVTNGIEVIGSADNVLTPGEESSFKIQIENTTELFHLKRFLELLQVLLTYIEIIDASGTWQSIDAGGYMVNSDDLFRVSAIDETIPGAMATLIPLALPQAMDIRQILLCKFKSVYQPLMIQLVQIHMAITL